MTSVAVPESRWRACGLGGTSLVMGSWLRDLRRGGEWFVRYRVTGARPGLSSADLAWVQVFQSRESPFSWCGCSERAWWWYDVVMHTGGG